MATDVSRFNELSWAILKHKVLYYRPSDKYVASRASVITDDQYDALEQEYLGLCVRLGRPNTLVHKECSETEIAGVGMMEVTTSRRSVNFMVRYLLGVL
jgi:hypothetical protein